MNFKFFSLFRRQNDQSRGDKPPFNLPGGPIGVRGNRLMSILLVALTVVTGLAFYFWYRSPSSNQVQIKNQNEVRSLVAEISKFLVLPTDEEPTVATVSDVAVLKNQPFFANAKTGDKVLIYTKTKKAILYDPVAKKIVEVAPINMGESVK